MISLFKSLFMKPRKDDTVTRDSDVTNKNITKISKSIDSVLNKDIFNSEHNKTLRNFTWYHSLVMDNEDVYKQGTPMNVSLTDGLHCIMHHVFWDDMEEHMNADRLQLNFYYKGELIIIIELDISREQVSGKVLHKEAFTHLKTAEITNKTYVKCMSPLIKKFELRWKKYKQEEKIANAEKKKQKKIREKRNMNNIDEFLKLNKIMPTKRKKL